MATEWIALADIEVGANRRPVDAAHVQGLAASIKEIGLQTPITVMASKDDDGWRSILVAGAHRLAALRLLGEVGAQCFVLPDDQDTADLWEIDENFARSELTPAQRADHHVRRRRILAARGVVHAAPGQPKKGTNLVSYAKQAAETLGVHENTVNLDLKRGEKIAPEVLAEATDLYGSELDQLARTPKPDQPAKLIEIREQRSAVRPAADPLNDPEAHEKQLAALMSAWNRAAAVVREEFLLRIDRPVFDGSPQ